MMILFSVRWTPTVWCGPEGCPGKPVTQTSPGSSLDSTWRLEVTEGSEGKISILPPPVSSLELQLTSSALAVLFCSAQQEQELAFARYTHPPPTTLFDSAQSQEYKSEVGAHEFYAAMRIKTHLDNTLYLSSLWSDLI